MSHKQPRSSAWTQGQDKHAEWVTTQIVSPCPVTSLQEERVSFKRTAQLELPANHQEAARSPTVELQGKLDLQPFSHRFYRITGPGSQQHTRPTPPRLYIAQVWKVGGMCPRSFAWFEAGLETKWAKKVQLFKFSQSLLQAQLCVHLWTFPRMSGSTAKSLSQCSSEAKWPDVQWWSKQEVVQRCTRRRLWKESRWLYFVWRDLGSMKQARLYRRPSVRKG